MHPHAVFERDGYNVYIDVPVTMVQAALGATLKVPTLDGLVDLKIPEGTQTDARFRMRGKGIPFMQGAAEEICMLLSRLKFLKI